jgi:transposase-like protein
MRFPERIRTDEPTKAVTAPTHCPTCRSQDVTTASKIVNSETYWRCGACGDVWNAGRRREPRYPYRHSSGG